MRTDYSYLQSEIFPRFLESDTAFIDLYDDLFSHFVDDEKTGIPGPKTEKFLHHWYMLTDANFISSPTDLERCISVTQIGDVGVISTPVRLTKDGQEFAENLENSKGEFIEKVKGYGLSVAGDVLKALIIQHLTS